MVINDIVKYIEFLKKKQRIGNISKQEITDALHRTQLDYFKFLFGLPEKYQLGRPVPPVYDQGTQKITDALTRFKVHVKSSNGSMAYVASTGIITLPSTYLHLTALFQLTGDNYTGIQIIDDTRWLDRLTRKTATVSNNPIARFLGNTIEVRPQGMTNLEMTYYRVPNKPVWGFTLDGNGRQIFDASTSTDLEWSEVHVNDILYRTLQAMGAALEDNWMTQYSTVRKNEV